MDLSETIEINRPDDNFESHPITFLDICDDDEYGSSVGGMEDVTTGLCINQFDKELEDAQEYLIQYRQYLSPIFKQKCLDICSQSSFLVKLFVLKELGEIDALVSLIKESNLSELNGTVVWETIVYCECERGIECSELFRRFIHYKEYPIEFRYYCLQSIKRESFENYYKECIQAITEEKKEFQFIIYMLECLRQINKCTYTYCVELYTENKDVWGENEKADFADFLLTMHSSDYNELATQLLQETGLTSNVYKSKQSVHDVDINTQAIHTLLNKVECLQSEKETIDRIEKECTTSHQKIAMKRVRYDNRMYNGETLSSLLRKLYWFIQTLDCKLECEKILYEELEDMGQRCSLGHYVRLLHVISGFTPEGIIKIDPKKELKASFFHKLEKAIQSSETSDNCLDALYTQNEFDIIKYIYPLITPITDECIKEYESLIGKEEIEEEIRNYISQYTLRDQ